MNTVPQTLEARTKAIREKLADGQRGPLIAASAILEIVDNWDLYKEEAGGLAANAWCVESFGAGRGVGYWRLRHEAVQALEGETGRGDVRRCFDHEVAVWLYRSVDAEHRQRAKVEVLQAYKAQKNPVPLTLPQVRLLVNRLLGRKSRARHCSRCRELELEVQRLRGLLDMPEAAE